MTVDPVRHRRAMASLRGLSIGDALGSQFFVPTNYPLLHRREAPPGSWQWTDDTEMAASVVAVLLERGAVHQDTLAASFAHRHDFDRGYGPAVNRMLRQIRQEGADWRELASALFDGRGSWGNGAAMRVAPLGAWFADDAERAAVEAEHSAFVTHQHREAVCGAMAVAAAAALRAAVPRWRVEEGPRLLDAVVELVPRSAVQAGLRRARDMLDYGDVATVAAVLGCGRRTSAHDTVPFALWAATRHGGDFTEAVWAAATAGGDVDTTCAIVGGVLASGPDCRVPEEWHRRAEPLPGWVTGEAARPAE
ncbi:ADP-ribosylglycohydrolase family protein [Streptomyces durbertensis]|uniref:ADP-ribosylglycohydrolase family protein n=1 Tax=Streptomyces durbertensis TaxID=2448886 RepID=A0ABR6EEQ9_9ACTN|nr:ADP-ribosylglycohydrolase family protein [Streptomyces durbertensis]MBB1243572.1 ADP-ribosylglycohydrolase family protein [Streptomyces durbertensis]